VGIRVCLSQKRGLGTMQDFWFEWSKWLNSLNGMHNFDWLNAELRDQLGTCGTTLLHPKSEPLQTA